MTAMDLILVILIGGFLLGRGGQTFECDQKLFWAGMSFLMYHLVRKFEHSCALLVDEITGIVYCRFAYNYGIIGVLCQTMIYL